MTTTIQVRNVPEAVSRALKAKAALEGRSLSDYLLTELDRIASRPSRAELLERISRRPSLDLPPAERVLSEERPAR
ncbi:MAG: toxin-antitoxin system, antitoxin component [Propionibacteriaceae bacterium]|nr:toxin-antitoxin system, antitoxin component [Propionibacteriaceae bacterium]